MYKVMIIDDEYIVRMDLRTIIDWKSMGLELTKDAENGNDALTKIAEFHPDILLLDITMPGMNGITLLTFLRESHFQGKIIMLSCHEDFDHVKEALVLGAEEYLLKHKLEPNMLVKALDSIVSKLEEERRQSDQIHKWVAIAEDSLQMYRKKFFQQLLSGYHIEIQKISQKLVELDLFFSLQLCVIVLVNIHDVVHEKQRLGSRSLEQMKDQLLEQINQTILEPSSGYCFDAQDGKLTMILGFSSVPSYLYLHNLVYSVSNQVLSLINADFKMKASIGVSDICSEIQQIPHFYQQAQEAVNGTFFLGKNRLIHYTEVKGYCNKPITSFKGYEERLLAAVKEGKQIAELVQEIYQGLLKQMVSLNEVKGFNFEFISFLKKVQREHAFNEQDLFGAERSPYEAINLMETVEEVQHFLRDVMIRLSEMLRNLSSSRGYRKEITNAIDYMMENYASDLSLEIMASYINMNSTYFSNLFKKETKENFVTFLQKMRVEKAKILLRNSEDKVYDIAIQVGIGNYHYFCKTFKQVSGVTPVQYRHLSRKG